jgi:hypothetical protein
MEETDGWYIDLPGFGCAERSGACAGVLIGNGNRRDRLQVKWLGKAPRGYPIEETSVKTEATNTIVSKTALLEISEAPLSPALFEPPTGYRLALQTGNGGADLTKPDTIFNRADYYRARMTLWLRSLFD